MTQGRKTYWEGNSRDAPIEFSSSDDEPVRRPPASTPKQAVASRPKAREVIDLEASRPRFSYSGSSSYTIRSSTRPGIPTASPWRKDVVDLTTSPGPKSTAKNVDRHVSNAAIADFSALPASAPVSNTKSQQSQTQGRSQSPRMTRRVAGRKSSQSTSQALNALEVSVKHISEKEAYPQGPDATDFRDGSSSFKFNSPSVVFQSIETDFQQNEMAKPCPTVAVPNPVFEGMFSGKTLIASRRIADIEMNSTSEQSSRAATSQTEDLEMHDAVDQLGQHGSTEVAFNFKSIKDLWAKQCQVMIDDHAYFARSTLAHARHKALQAAKDTRQRIKDSTNETRVHQTDPQWYKTLPALGKKLPMDTDRDDALFYIESFSDEKDAHVSVRAIPVQKITPKALKIPSFHSYFPLRNSQQVPSNPNVPFWPPLVDYDLDEEAVKGKTAGEVDFEMEYRKDEVENIQQGIRLQPYAKRFLENLGLSEIMMLRFLLDESYDEDIVKPLYEMLGNLPRPVGGITAKKTALNLHKQTRKHARMAPQWDVLKRKVPSIAARECDDEEKIKKQFEFLAIAHYTIVSYVEKALERHPQDQPLFNFIYILAESDELELKKLLSTVEQDPLSGKQYSLVNHWELACRVCYKYECYEHGIPSTWDYDPPQKLENESHRLVQVLGEDAACRPMYNFLKNLFLDEMGHRPVRRATGQRNRDIEFDQKALYGDPNNQHKSSDPKRTASTVFFPCDHKGPCVVNICRCARHGYGDKSKHFCEKSCGCARDCPRRFKGCKCARQGKLCAERNQCPCVDANRECDPDLCGSCGVVDVLNPINRDKEGDFLKQRCQNCSIQLGVPALTLIGPSTTHLIGLFAGRDIRKREFIGEYGGEVMTYRESERVGLVFGLGGSSYLFDKTGDQTVDSMNMGNKIRFMNHSNNPRQLNCAVKYVTCNTVVRLGMFALRDIRANEELFFDYGEKFEFMNGSYGGKLGGSDTETSDCEGPAGPTVTLKSKTRGISSRRGRETSRKNPMARQRKEDVVQSARQSSRKLNNAAKAPNMTMRG